MNIRIPHNTLYIILSILFVIGCAPYKESFHTQNEYRYIKNLSFKVYNKTDQAVFVTCFYYATREKAKHWMWYKTPVQAIEPQKKITITLHDIIHDVMKDVYGYLAVFTDRDEAEDSVYELLEDQRKVELDKIIDSSFHDQLGLLNS